MYPGIVMVIGGMYSEYGTTSLGYATACREYLSCGSVDERPQRRDGWII